MTCLSVGWSPGHIVIVENELADREAKSAIFDIDSPICNGYYRDTKICINTYVAMWTYFVGLH